MFQCCHHMSLRAASKTCAHFANMMRVFAVGFLCTAPRRVTQKIDADTTVEVCTNCAKFFADGIADSHFELRVKRCTACHRNWKRSCFANYESTRSIRKMETRYAESLNFCSPERPTVIAARCYIFNAHPKWNTAV